MEKGERCPCCGYRRRTYKQRGFPVRDKVLAVLKNGPMSAPSLARAVGVKPNTIHNYLRQYEKQGAICRRGLEAFDYTHTFTRTLSKRTNTVKMQHYRALWGLPDERRA